MKRRSWKSMLLAACFSTLPFTFATAANAQVDEAMSTNWDNVGKLYPMIVAAFDAGKQEDVYKLTDEFRANLDYVEDKLNRVGQRLHEKDKNWGWSSKKETAMNKTRDLRVAAGLLGSTTKSEGLVKAQSSFKDFKDKWAVFVDMVNALRIEYMAHAKELTDIAKAFKEDCQRCPQ